MKKGILILFLLFCVSDAFAREHPYFISDIIMSNDAKYIAIRRMDNKIVILNREEKKVYKVLEDMNRVISNLIAFTPDSKQFVFQHSDLDLIFYDLYTQKVIKKIPIKYSLTSIAIYNDLNRIICGGINGKIEVINVTTNERQLIKVEDPEAKKLGRTISSIKLSPDENYFVTTTPTGTWFGDSVTLEEPEQDTELLEQKKVPSGNIVESWNVKHIGLNLWDAKTFKKIKKMRAEFLEGRTWFDFSPNGKYILATSENGITLWDIKRGELLFENHHLTNGNGFINSNYFVTLWHTEKDALTAYNVDDLIQKRELYKTLKAKPAPCTGAIVTDPARNLIVIGTEDGSISVYKFNPNKLDIDLEWHPKSVEAGLIKWLSPADTMFKTTDEVNEMVKQYEINQLRLIDEDCKKGTVETTYEKIQVQEEKQKDQKQPVSTLIPVK